MRSKDGVTLGHLVQDGAEGELTKTAGRDLYELPLLPSAKVEVPNDQATV